MKPIFITFLKSAYHVLPCLLFASILITGSSSAIFAHGGEDHGDAKPKTTQSAKGTVSHVARLGHLELMLKHPELEPDTATAARLFITEYATNEPVTKVDPTVEFESSRGEITACTIEKTDVPGTFTLKIPALPEGIYTVRAKLLYDGSADTASFSGVTIEHPVADVGDGSISSPISFLIVLVGAFVLGLFGILFYFVWRMAGQGLEGDEPVSA